MPRDRTTPLPRDSRQRGMQRCRRFSPIRGASDAATMADQQAIPRRLGAVFLYRVGWRGERAQAFHGIHAGHAWVCTERRRARHASVAPVAAASDTEVNTMGKETEGTPAAKPKKARRNLTQWVNKRFQGFVDRINAVRRARGPASARRRAAAYRDPAGSTHSSPATSRRNMAGQNRYKATEDPNINPQAPRAARRAPIAAMPADRRATAAPSQRY